ncbi:MAG: hypothetical protein ACSW8H_00200 [bacterium]
MESRNLTDKDDRENAESITHVSAAANLTVYKKVKEDREMNDGLPEIS